MKSRTLHYAQWKNSNNIIVFDSQSFLNFEFLLNEVSLHLLSSANEDLPQDPADHDVTDKDAQVEDLAREVEVFLVAAWVGTPFGEDKQKEACVSVCEEHKWNNPHPI